MSNITTYLISASLIFLVIRQTCEHPPDAPVPGTAMLAVAAAAVMFLHSVPAGGSDLALEAAGVAASAAMGAIGGLATKLRLSADARPPGRAGWLAASTWVGGVDPGSPWQSPQANAQGRPSPGSASRTASPVRRPGWRRW
jgi:hypothetical protein